MQDTIRLPISGDVELAIARHRAEELVRRWSEQLGLNPEGTPPQRPLRRLLPDDHPRWDQHSGGEGHGDDPEWDRHSDGARAEAFYQLVNGKARVLLDILIDHPGEPLTVEELCALAEGTFSGSRSIAGTLYGLHRAHRASGRRYPFYWWAGRPAEYAMKAGVAALFKEARTNVTPR